MGGERAGAGSHYEVLGVSAEASQKEVERAFERWRERRRRGAVAFEEYARAEAAYGVLSDPGRRTAHDRQIGRLAHPAWRGEALAAASRCHRAGLREMARGRHLEAAALMRRAVALDPYEPAYRSCLGLLTALTGGCLHTAARHALTALARCPDEPAFCFNLARVYSLAGLPLRAVRLRSRGWRLLVRRALRRPSH